MESGKEMKNQRMLDELTELMRIDVSSGQETEIAEHLVKKLEQMGFAITRDEAGATFGGVCGNILAVREGERDGVVCFCSHMDRVPGGIGIKPVEEDGDFTVHAASSFCFPKESQNILWPPMRWLPSLAPPQTSA